MAEPTKMTSPGFGRSGEEIVITFAASRCHGEVREDGQAHYGLLFDDVPASRLVPKSSRTDASSRRWGSVESWVLERDRMIDGVPCAFLLIPRSWLVGHGHLTRSLALRPNVVQPLRRCADLRNGLWLETAD
jgi:hypothetical protein